MKRWKRRKYEQHALVAVRKERVIVLFWTRRGRKSTNLGAIAFDEMSKEPGRSVISASASLLLGTELVNMTVSATEQAILVANEAAAVQAVFESSAAEKKLAFKCADAVSGKIFEGMTREDFAQLYSSKRLEMRLYHDRTNYSRQLVIAPNPATARGWRGTVLRDEAGFTSAALELALREAVDPIFRDVPDLKMIYASNLCRDDAHPYFEMTLPPPDLNLPVNPAGNFYRGENGILVHRVTLRDAYAAGHVLYDNKGNPMTYEQFASDPANKSQMPYNYDLTHQEGGSAAIDFVAMMTAQARGAGECAFVYMENDRDFQRALDLLRAHLGSGQVGIGYDPATTTNGTSNPTALTVTEKNGTQRFQRLVLCFKEKKPQIARDRIYQILDVIKERPVGGPARRLCIAATNERYFAEELSDLLRGIVPVELVIESANIHPPGYHEPVNFKTYLADLYSTEVNENHYALPSDKYFKDDQRLTVKNKGRYECTAQTDGKHGDTFVSGGLAEYALIAGGPAEIHACQVGSFGNNAGSGGWKNPYANRHMEGASVNV